MPRPVVSLTLERLYARLPEVYRVHDEPLDWPLLRYLSLEVDQAGEVETLLDRLIGGDLADPLLADFAWLTWLGQQVGVLITPNLTDAEARDAISTASSGWRGGTKDGLELAARTVLTGTKYANAYDHSSTTANKGTQPWTDVLLVTRGTETPTPADVVPAIIRKNAKPAGVMLYHATYEASWDAIVLAYPTWTAIEAAGSWDAIQEAGL